MAVVGKSLLCENESVTHSFFHFVMKYIYAPNFDKIFTRIVLVVFEQ